MNNHKQDQWGFLFLGTAILMGGIVRLVPPLLVDFPVVDGGMFYTMINDILANKYVLPIFTTYNNHSIPFLYPFFSFYLTAFISDVTHLPVLGLIQFLPAVIATISIQFFYLMAKNLLGSPQKASFATLAFAFIPSTFSWFVLGGGLSRSFYQLFIILAVTNGYKLFTCKENNYKYLALTILFNSLTVLSHPEASIHALAIGVLLVLFYGRDRQGFFSAVLVAIGVLLGTSVWWIPAFLQHGLSPIVSAIQAGGHSFFSIWGALVPRFGEERNISLFTVFALLGIAAQLHRRHFFLISWFILPFIVEPRSASAISVFPLALLSSIGFAEIIVPSLLKNLQTQKKIVEWTIYFQQSKLLRVSLLYVIFIAFFGAFSTSLNIAAGSTDPFYDPAQEWFPALTERVSQNTIQGQEWILGTKFRRFHQSLDELQSCMDIDCINKWAGEFGRSYNYIYVHQPSLLGIALELSSDFHLIYNIDNLAIFSVGNNHN